MSNQFCRYLSNGYSFSITNNSSVIAGPCCWYGNKIPFDSQFLQNRTVTFNLINNWTDGCSACKTLENAG